MTLLSHGGFPASMLLNAFELALRTTPYEQLSKFLSTDDER